MTSVRLRLLVIALLPLIVLMPLLLLLGLSRWTTDYDNVLTANVESDLRIAEQYLGTIMLSTREDLGGVAQSVRFADAIAGGGRALDGFLATEQKALGLDFLYYLPRPETAPKWPVIRTALNGLADSRIDIFDADDLRPLSLADAATVELIETEAAVPTDRSVEDRGMIVHAAAPVGPNAAQGVLVGGILLNHNLQFIDRVNALVYLNAVTGGERQGTATLFLEDVRVSTNVRLFEDVRALGTRVSAEVRRAVLGEGRTWLARAFVVNDWYVSGYLPINDSFGVRVGMLYVGFLEAPFAAAKRDAFIWMLGAFLVVLAISAPVFLWLARGIFAPLERMIQTMTRVERGDLAARNGNIGGQGEIGQVAAHLDRLLGEIQLRDRDLNARVEARTTQLREANAKLEATTQQLVMSEKLAAIGEITAGVAHEINNPVAVIQGNVDVIRDALGSAAAPVETELSLIDRQISRISAIVGKLLKFARPADFGDGAEIELRPVIEECLLLVDHVLRSQQIAVQTHFEPAPSVRIDLGEFQQVIVNLIVNAAQAMQTSGSLIIRLRAQDRDGVAGVCLTLDDTGPGIPKDKIGSVFDPFFTTKPGEGTGLGLSISQTIVRSAGGWITAHNREDGGARFEVWLPAAAS
ncbi:cache domain-containing protein [Sulfitobacter sp. S190]|uniref:sensor histidine kinase n=1 Tax=Sulfitobacter sp. S190 TaxID=2867022 RepID=UPI0021A8812E|nr:cache domain-containing protein [Sulfitobacter sp. S190]UWR24411.1 cache domain-containing protein [Sulfitobacter sp. S190]